MTRPLVLLFQETATPTVVPVTPDLNCLILGPAYQVLDFPDDRANIQVSNYGTLNADNPYTPPVAFVPAITLAAPPGIVAGGWVDPASVRVFFDKFRVRLAVGTDGTTVVTAPNENTFTSAGATFQTAGVQAGDILIVDNPSGPLTPNLKLTISGVDSQTVLRVTSNFTAAVAGTLRYRVERALSNTEIDDTFVSTQTFRTSNQIQILGGVTVPVGGTPRIVTYAEVYVGYRAYRTDLQTLDTVVSTQEILTKIGKIDARNPLAAGCFVALQNSGQAPIQFFGVDTDDLVGYNKAKDVISPLEDIYAIVPLNPDLNIVAAFKADNESLADPLVSLSTGVPQKFRVVIGNGTLPVTEDISDEVVTGNTEALAGAVPPGIRTINIPAFTALTSNLRPGDQLILSASPNVAPLDGTYTIAHINSNTQIELDQALPATVGVAEGINYQVVRPSTGATIIPLVDNRAHYDNTGVRYFSRVAGVAAGARTIQLFQDATVPGGINSIVEVANVSTIINGDWAAASITAAQVASALNTGAGVTIPFSGSINLVALAFTPALFPVAVGATAVSGTVAGVDGLASTTALDTVFIRFYDAAATFLTDGVLPGDILEIPQNPNGVFAPSGNKRFTVNAVVSEQRLEITNIVSGLYVNNSSVVEAELPHFDNRLGTGTLVTPFTIRYRVIRDLTKTQQVTQLVAESQSLNSRRALLAWPDVLTVSGLVDNSKPKNPDGTAAAADPQPGYYAAAGVGGMTAGYPSHQGFSRLGVVGISRLTHSSDYFSEQQLTDLSDGGWYVFVQQAPTSIPYSIHQLTTDPATLESGEYSIVKNFDFVSVFYVSVLDPFLGIWNINNDTLGFIRQALNTGTENLKLRRVARIGAPINDASITSLEVSTASADRVEVFMEVDLPKPLNVIGLHLVG